MDDTTHLQLTGPHLCKSDKHTASLRHRSALVIFTQQNPNAVTLLRCRGGDTLRVEHSFPSEEHVRLALTCWQNGSFEVLHSTGAEQLSQVLPPCAVGQPKQPPALGQAALRHMQPGLGLLPLPIVPLPVAPLSAPLHLSAAEWRIAAVQVRGLLRCIAPCLEGLWPHAG